MGLRLIIKYMMLSTKKNILKGIDAETPSNES